MLQQDYIMRLIQEFAAALQRFLEKKEVSDRSEAIKDLYRQYLDDYELYHITTMDEVMQSFVRYPEEQRIHRMEMLADLYYVEADLKSEPTRTTLLERALQLFTFIDRHSRTLSFERQRKISDIKKLLEVRGSFRGKR